MEAGVHKLERQKCTHGFRNANGAVFVGCDNGYFRSADHGQTWKQVFDGGMILNIVAADGVLIGGGSQGVLRSTDGGEHWESVFDENILAKKTGRLKDDFVTILGTKDPTKINPEGITAGCVFLLTGAKPGSAWSSPFCQWSMFTT